jgi:hypothetical protein
MEMNDVLSMTLTINAAVTTQDSGSSDLLKKRMRVFNVTHYS